MYLLYPYAVVICEKWTKYQPIKAKRNMRALFQLTYLTEPIVAKFLSENMKMASYKSFTIIRPVEAQHILDFHFLR